MKALSLLLISLTISALSSSAPRVSLSRSSTPAPAFLSPYLADPERLDLKAYPYIVMASFREGHDPELPMAIAFHTSNTFIANCPSFKVFNCALYPENCLTFPSMPFRLDYPFFNIEGVMMDLKFTIGNYVRTRPASIHYATKCSGNSYHTKEVVGAVGLSIGDSNYNNIYTENHMYSVFLTDDGTGGELIFGQDLGHVNDDWNLTMRATANWELTVYSIVFGPRRLDTLHSAIFDLTAPFIGVPANLYLEIIKELKETYLLNCQWDVPLPECLYPDDINLLPNLTLAFWSALTPLDVPPSLYMRKIRDNRYQLLLAGLAIDPHKKGIIHVTPTYVNYAILGYPFLKHYYTVFDYNDLLNPVVTIYHAKQAEVVPDNPTAQGIAIGAVILGVLVLGALIACFWAIQRSRTKAAEQASRERAQAHPAIIHPPNADIKEPFVTRTTLVAQ